MGGHKPWDDIFNAAHVVNDMEVVNNLCVVIETKIINTHVVNDTHGVNGTYGVNDVDVVIGRACIPSQKNGRACFFAAGWLDDIHVHG